MQLAPSFTPQSLICNSFVGITGSCQTVSGSPNTVNVTGMSGTSQITFQITNFISPVSAPSDYTVLTSFENGYMVDQSSNSIRFAINCILPCKTCTSNKSACLSCYNNPDISSLNLYFPTNSQCLNLCPTGYYETTSLTCLSCATTCLTCSILSTNCTSCNTSSANPALNLTNSIGTCLSACPIYYYLSSIATPPQCVPCDQVTYHCSICTAINLCSTCIANYFLYNNTCSNSCPLNTTIANNGTWTCDPCSSQCATCMGTLSNCTTCSATSAKYNGQCLSTCPYPLVIKAGTCDYCDSYCKICSIVSSNCTACYTTSSLPYLSTTNTSIGTCLNSCPYSYYGDLTNGACVSCSPLNIGCTNCSSPTTCYTCDSGYIFYLNTCLLNPPLGFYNNSGIASPCSSQCATCHGLSNNCTSCLGNLSLNGNQCSTTCPIGQVGVSNLCTDCSSASQCLTCSVTTTFCTSCILNATSPKYLSDSHCIDSCPNYTYPDSSNRTCQPCTTSSHC